MYSAKLVIVFLSAVAAAVAKNSTTAKFESGCDQVYTKKQFILESPRYPSNYPLNYECSYLIKGSECPTYFNLQFLDFNLENSTGCEKDRLEIGNQDALCGTKNTIRTYFAAKGSLVLKLVSDLDATARGFRILVTRLPCGVKNPETTTIAQRSNELPDWPNNDVEYTTTKKPLPLKKCCQNSYNEKNFVITSPNFPYSMSSESDCVYEIHKTSPEVCRLRIHVQFFWLDNQNNCPGGYLEIDGKFICGCKSDLRLISPFQGNAPKILRFVSRGYERSSRSGFVMEIIQDECPKRYVPTQVAQEKFRFYNDQINRIAWPKNCNDSIAKLRLISKNTEVVNSDLGPKNEQNIIKHFYVFGEDEPDQFPSPRDKEETNYVDTFGAGTILGGSGDYGACLSWNKRQIYLLSSKNLQTCQTNQIKVPQSDNCVELNYQKGFFKSPGYPFFYGRNLNICYRFRKLQGYCAIKVYMNDFQLENSLSCQKDYLLLGNQYRYCGNGLANTISTFDLSSKSFEDAYFVTDAFNCGRGFFGIYEQIACRDMDDPINPPPLPSTPPPAVLCDRTIQDRVFTLDVYDHNGPTCSFIIRKYSQNVCRIKLYFEKFDLVCASESLVVDGTMYCGHMSGQSTDVDLRDEDVIVVTYRKISNYYVTGERLRIRGEQIEDRCFDPEVPAERLLSRKSFNVTPTFESKYLLKMNKEYRDLCGIVTNSTQTKLPESFCDLIRRNNNNITMCVPLVEDSIIVPLQSQKIELKVKDVATTEEIEFEEIDCDNMSNEAS